MAAGTRLIANTGAARQPLIDTCQHSFCIVETIYYSRITIHLSVSLNFIVNLLIAWSEIEHVTN